MKVFAPAAAAALESIHNPKYLYELSGRGGGQQSEDHCVAGDYDGRKQQQKQRVNHSLKWNRCS